MTILSQCSAVLRALVVVFHLTWSSMLTAVMRFSDRQILASNTSSAVPTSPPISLANVICYFVNNKDENPRSRVFEVNVDKQDTEVFHWIFFYNKPR